MSRATPDTQAGSTADSPVDYGELYRAYWSRPDRWGSHSFADPEPICDQILTTCGGGSVLDVGCGMGLLVRTLLRRGVDARGVDVAQRPVDEANRLAPGRFSVGSITALPFADEAFETVVSTDVLEHVAEADVPQALAELARVTNRYAFVRLAITPDRDHTWHLTVRDRAWWEARFFEAGFARHPLAQRVVAYEALNDEGWQITLIMEKVRSAPPLPAGLDDDRLCDRDVLREVGRAAEAGICRATRGLWFVRPGDTVVDVAGGLGWRSAILATGTRAQRVISLDPREEVTRWARERFGGLGLPLEFLTAPLGDLSGFADRSVGVLVAMDVLDRLAEPEAFLDEARRVLAPGGRLIVGDPAAGDPDRWTSAITSRFATERLFVQALGSEPGSDGDAPPRAMRIIDDEQDPALTPDWTMRVVCSQVVGAPAAGYVEKSYPDHTDKAGFHVAHYARDHDNPWLLRAMISMGMRSPNRQLIEQTAREVLDTARAGSPDEGSAICVLAYRVLETDNPDPDEARALLGRIEAYHGQADGSPHAWRWRISNQFVAGRLHLALGELDEAEVAFLACAEMDVLRFSPLLASKTIDALFHAGLIAANAGRADEARARWVRALEELRRVLAEDWLNIWGSAEDPLPFGLPDVGIMIDLASRCAHGLLWLGDWSPRPGLAWTWTHQRSLSDHRRWIARLEESRNWLDRERGRIRTLAISRERTIAQLKDWAGKLQASQQWTANQRDELRQRLDQRTARLSELKSWTRAQTEARAWLGERVDELSRIIAKRDATIDQLRQRVAKLDEARGWLERQLTTARARASGGPSTGWLKQQIATRDERIATLTDRLASRNELIASLTKARDWLAQRAQRAQQRLEDQQQIIAQRGATIASLRAHIATLAQAKDWIAQRGATARKQRDEARAAIAGRDETIAALREHIGKLAVARDWLTKHAQAAQQRADETQLIVTQRDETIASLREHIGVLAQAKDWLAQQTATARAQRDEARATIAQRDETIAHLREHADALAKARAWIATQRTIAREQLDEARAAIAQRDETIASLQQHIATLAKARDWQRDQTTRARAARAATADQLERVRAWAAVQRGMIQQLVEGREALAKRLGDERHGWQALGLATDHGVPLPWTRTARADLASLRAWAESMLTAKQQLQTSVLRLQHQHQQKNETIADLRRQIQQLKSRRSTADRDEGSGLAQRTAPTSRDSQEPGTSPDDQP